MIFYNRLSDQYQELHDQGTTEQSRFIQMLRVCSVYFNEEGKQTFARNLFHLVVWKISESMGYEQINFETQLSEHSMSWEVAGACIPVILLMHPCWDWSIQNVDIFKSILTKISLEVLLKPVNFDSLIALLNGRAGSLVEWLTAQTPEAKELDWKTIISEMIPRLPGFQFQTNEDFQVIFANLVIVNISGVSNQLNSGQTYAFKGPLLY